MTIEIGDTFAKPEPGFGFIAETFTKAGCVRVYKHKTGLYLTTTDHRVRQVNLDPDELACYLYHIAVDSSSVAFKEEMGL